MALVETFQNNTKPVKYRFTSKTQKTGPGKGVTDAWTRVEMTTTVGVHPLEMQTKTNCICFVHVLQINQGTTSRLWPKTDNIQKDAPFHSPITETHTTLARRTATLTGGVGVTPADRKATRAHSTPKTTCGVTAPAPPPLCTGTGTPGCRGNNANAVSRSLEVDTASFRWNHYTNHEGALFQFVLVIL